MKKLLLLFVLFSSLFSYSQVGDIRAHRVIADSSIYLRGSRADTLTSDTTNASKRTKTILTAKGVYDLFSRAGVDTASLSNRIDQKVNTGDSITAYVTPTQMNSQGYLTSVDTSNIPNFWSKVRSLFNAGYGILLSNGTIISDTTTLAASFLRGKDSTIYYPYASNPLNYISRSGISGTDPIGYDNYTGKISFSQTFQDSIRTGKYSLNFANTDLTATGDRTHTFGSNVLGLTFNSLAGANGLSISSNSTAASGNNQRLVSISLSGANVNSNQATSALYVTNYHTGTGVSNYGISAYTDSNGASLYGHSIAGFGVYGQSTSNAGVYGVTSTGYGGLFLSSGSGTGLAGQSSTGYGIQGISTSGIGGVFSSSGAGVASLLSYGSLPAILQYQGSDSSTVKDVLQLFRFSSGTLIPNAGSRIYFGAIFRKSLGVNSGSIENIVTDTTLTGYNSQFNIVIDSSANNTTALNIQSGGILRTNNNKDTLATRSYARSVGGAGGSSTYAGLTDVNLSSLSDGQLVKYDNASGKWINFTPSYLSSIDTSNISNFYLKVRSLLSAGTGIGYNNGTGVITNNGVVSLNGNTGALTMDTGYISNFYTKVRSEISLTTTGTSGAATYNSATGVLNIPQYSGAGATTLSSLTDVNVSSLANNDFFQYQTSDSKWHNRTVAQVKAALGIDTNRYLLYDVTLDSLMSLNTTRDTATVKSFGLYKNGNRVSTYTGTNSKALTYNVTIDSSDITNFYSKVRSLFSTAAGSGAYNSGTGVITIPTNTNQLTNGAGYLSSVDTSNISSFYSKVRSLFSFSAGSGAYNSGTGVITIPTNTSQLTNGAGFITGNQTITLSGDVSGSGSTSISTTVSKINGTSLAGLATGILKNTTGTGVPSIAVASDFPTLNQNTTGSAATLTTTRTIWGQNFNGSANVTGDITLGTGNLTMTGSIASTGSRVTKIWATDGEFTNAPTVGGTALPTASSTTTFTNKRITLRTGSTTSSATPTINTDNYDKYTLTAQAVDITSMTTNLSGTPTEGQLLIIEITGTATRAITWGSSFEQSSIAIPTSTSGTSTLTTEWVWSSTDSKWRLRTFY